MRGGRAPKSKDATDVVWSLNKLCCWLGAVWIQINDYILIGSSWMHCPHSYIQWLKWSNKRLQHTTHRLAPLPHVWSKGSPFLWRWRPVVNMSLMSRALPSLVMTPIWIYLPHTQKKSNPSRMPWRRPCSRKKWRDLPRATKQCRLSCSPKTDENAIMNVATYISMSMKKSLNRLINDRTVKVTNWLGSRGVDLTKSTVSLSETNTISADQAQTNQWKEPCLTTSWSSTSVKRLQNDAPLKRPLPWTPQQGTIAVTMPYKMM